MQAESMDLNIRIGGLYICTPRWASNVPEHTDEHRFYVGVRGEAGMEIDGKRQPLRGKRVYFIPARHPTTRHCTARFEVYWLHFRPVSPRIHARLCRLNFKSWPEERWSSFRETWTRFPEFFDERSLEMQLRMHALLWSALAELLAAAPGPSPGEARAWETLRPAFEFMDASFTRSPTLAELAEAVHLSPIHFHRRFKAATGQTPHEYMEHLRMQQARRMLAGGAESVSAIAEACGYANPFYFSRAFKRIYGRSPLQYRRSGPQGEP